MKENAVLRLSMYSPNDRGHGGVKRTAQINELLTNKGIKVFDLCKNSSPKLYKEKIKYILIGVKLLIKHNRFKLSISKIREGQLIGYTLYTLKKQVEDIKLNFIISSFIWEYTWPKYWYIPLIVNNVGLKVVGFPHNLESLVYSQKSYKKITLESPFWFDEEIEYLGFCDEIFTISREEQWLLSLMMKNKKIKFLPYFATQGLRMDLLRIRVLRTTEKLSNDIIVLGSAVNPPTLKGLVQLKEYIINKKIDNFNFEFVGFGMKALTNEEEKTPKNIAVYDSISNEVLETKLIRTKCVLIFQIPSTGALTKIHELQLAGVPIIVNFHGARSYFNRKGVVVIENINDLKNKLNDISDFEIPEVPIVNSVLEEIFINSVLS